jgi:hypothetical protein
MVIAKVMARLSISKQASQKFHMERFNPKNLNYVEVKEQYQIKISNRLSALENLNYNVDISRAWRSIRKNIKTSAKETLGHYKMKQHKLWFDHECSKLPNKLQWLQIPSQIKGDNLRCV